jgi:hypothetical protein
MYHLRLGKVTNLAIVPTKVPQDYRHCPITTNGNANIITTTTNRQVTANSKCNPSEFTFIHHVETTSKPTEQRIACDKSTLMNPAADDALLQHIVPDYHHMKNTLSSAHCWQQ